MAKKVSTRRIKANRHYRYDDAARLLGLSTQTVRGWRKEGLIVLTGKKPHVILGEHLIEFVEARQKPRIQMEPDQFRCFTCQVPRRALDRVVFYTDLTASRGQLEAFCEECGGTCSRFSARSKLPGLTPFFEIVMPKVPQA